MDNIEGGYILNSNDVVEKNKVKFQINIETHLIIIDFIDEVTIIDDSNTINHLFLLDSCGNKLTILDCHIEKRSNRKVEILFSTIVLGKHEKNPDELKPSKVHFGIGSDPIPLLDIHLPKKAVELDNITFEFQDSKDNSYICNLIITPTKGSLLLADLETAFFNIMDILFLCFGFYPYIDNERIIFDGEIIRINRLQLSKYHKGSSFAHWSTILASGSNIDLEKAYPKFCSMKDKNGIIIEALTNAIHSSDLIIDFTLSILIQCVEGYIRQWHGEKKFPDTIKKTIQKKFIGALDDINFIELEDITEEYPTKEAIINSINGLLGHLNSPSLGDCLKQAYNLNDNTKLILAQEIENQSYDDFISKSKATRNQFSHMSPKKRRFDNINEIIIAKEKYVLLLRLMMLHDLGININGNLKGYINKINKRRE